MKILILLSILIILLPTVNAQTLDKFNLEEKEQFGYTISSIGDLNGDGVNDIAVGAYHDDDGGYNTGAVYILFLNSDGTVKSHQKISSTEGMDLRASRTLLLIAFIMCNSYLFT